MNWKRRLGTILAACLAAGLAAAETAVPVNGDFEQGMAGWKRRGRGPDAPGNIAEFMTLSTDAAQGARSLKLSDPWTDCSPYGTLEVKPVPYEEEYLVRCQVKAPAGQPFSIGAQYLSPTKYLGATAKRFTGTGKWEPCEYRINNMPAECSTALVTFSPSANGGFAATGTMLIDAVTITRRPNPDVKKSQTYYISPAGNDDFAGTAEFPWLTVGKANAALKPGDTAVFLPGRYNGCISPARSGRPGHPITYRAQTPGTVYLSGGWSPAFGGISAIAIKDRAHIAIDGFSARDTWNSRWLLLENVTDSTFSHLNFSGTDIANGLRCKGVRRCRFSDFFAERSFSLRSGQVAYDMWNNIDCSQNVYERLYIRMAGHRPFGMSENCVKNVVRDTVFDCRYGRNFEMFDVRELLMERCVLTNAYEGSGSADPRAKIFSFDSIFRRNVVFRNAGIPIASASYKYSGHPFGMSGMRFYHNTLAFNDEAGWELSDLQAEQVNSDNRFLNNIFAHNDRFGAGTGVWNRNVRPGNPMIRNLFYGRKPNDTVIRLDDRWLTVAEAEKEFADRFSGSLDADPRFTAPAKMDFSLRPDSPALNAGAPAAVLTADADGATVNVSDAAMFYDGYGIPGEKGDEIVIGGTHALVTKTDRKANTLTLDRAVKAAKGAEIQFAWAVGKPDLGAYETGRDAANPKIPAGCYVPGFDEPHGVYTVDFELADSEKWFYFFHYATFSRSFARIDDRDPVRRCLMLYATDVAGGRGAMPSEARPLKPGEAGSRLAVSIRPQHWDIDVYPIMKFDYRISPGVQWNMIAFPFYTPDRKYWWVTLGSTDNDREDWMPNLKLFRLVNDGKWHTLEVDLRQTRKFFPGVRAFRRIDWGTPITQKFGGTAAPGSRAWIDNFQLIPVSGK